MNQFNLQMNVEENNYTPLDMNLQQLSINQQRHLALLKMKNQDCYQSKGVFDFQNGNNYQGLVLTKSSSSGISSDAGNTSPRSSKQSSIGCHHASQSPTFGETQCSNLQMYQAASKQYNTNPFTNITSKGYFHHSTSESSGNEANRDSLLSNSSVNKIENTENLEVKARDSGLGAESNKPYQKLKCQAPCHHKCKIGVTCSRHGPKLVSKMKRKAEKEKRAKEHPNKPPPIKSVVPPPVPKNQQNGYQTLKELHFVDAPNTIPGTAKTDLFEKYKIYNVIGIGGGGTVYAGRRASDGTPIAVKRILRQKVKRWERTIDGRNVPQEIALMLRCNGHVGIAYLYDWYETVESFILILERPETSIDLFDYIREQGPLSEDVSRHILVQIIQAVCHLHACGMVHRDIKDENIVLDRATGLCKLIDFGCGTNLKEGAYTEFSGTAEFYPPEWFNLRRYWAGSATVWSMGVLLFDMLQGEIPFKNSDRIIENKPLYKEPITLQARDLIRSLLNNDYRRRPDFFQILEHPWVRAIKTQNTITQF